MEFQRIYVLQERWLTAGFSGSGGAGKTPSPKKLTSLARGAYPKAAKPLSAANGVGWLLWLETQLF
jgi:hypothetical protein